jgi:hypothetical protein
MNNDKNDKIVRLYSRLTSLKANLPTNSNFIKEIYVRDYHDIINNLSTETSHALEEFKVPENEIRPIKTMHRHGDNETETSYSENKYCERALLMSKLDAVLAYFQMRYLSHEKPKIGFTPPG